MNSSSNSAREAESVPAIRPFPYTELPAPPGAESGVLVEVRRKPAENEGAAAAKVQAEHAAGRAQWEAQVRAGFEQRLQEIRDSMGAALVDFSRQRAAYFLQVEAEVVQLALAIARKILRREAEIDPLLLAGMVRVALERIDRGTRVTVRVHPQQVSECRAHFAQRMEVGGVPEVLEDPSLALDHCIVLTDLGTTELGPEVQLKEIERGLLDIIERRPRAEP